jgi:hypothetical protein
LNVHESQNSIIRIDNTRLNDVSNYTTEDAVFQ